MAETAGDARHPEPERARAVVVDGARTAMLGGTASLDLEAAA
jgi:hypothetical protein